VLLPGGGAPIEVGSPEEIMETSPVAPPLVELGRLMGWRPLPLTVRDARRQGSALRQQISSRPLPQPADQATGRAEVALTKRLRVSYADVLALDDVDLVFGAGEIVAVMGRNGSGKSSLLNTMAGIRAPSGGSVRIDGADPRKLPARALIRQVGLVPQDPGLLLYGESVAAECAAADKVAALEMGTTARALARVLPGMPEDRHPRDLSEGQRLALALAVVLAPSPALLLLDEPTRGLDYPSKDRLIVVLRSLARLGHAVILATHDVELVARVADRAVVLADGQVIADGPARQVVCHSPVFAPQVAKVFAPDEWLTVDEVRAALCQPEPS
jgi:energy-coupling factor transporter ATP-binding protein EcfA2